MNYDEGLSLSRYGWRWAFFVGGIGVRSSADDAGEWALLM
ncbi:hypothetical protein Ga0466249_003838 [Sporomusaceae bacterium BoRhaA]|nr:hypothetical protein [Pelorhabdus rhamnosifermentans]